MIGLHMVIRVNIRIKMDQGASPKQDGQGMDKAHKIAVILFAASLLLGACATAPQTPVPAPTPTAVPQLPDTADPADTPTTLTPTAEPQPSDTADPADTPTPTHEQDSTPLSPTDDGPNGATYILQSEFSSVESHEVVTDGIFAIWWDPIFDHTADAAVMLEQLNAIRTDCLDNLAMTDPPNPTGGFYYNVYIHHDADDGFPEWWGNGQGTDSYGMPYLTLPNGAHIERSNLYHEGFHIFQYGANSPGFAYAGDSQWYIESAAQWYQASKMPDDERSFVEAGAITANPQLALWHSFGNEAPGDPIVWLFQVRQYGMHTLLYFLTSQSGVNPAIITNGFYSGTFLSPQAYLYEQIGGNNLRGYFADWAAHNTGGFDYLTPAQVRRGMTEVEYEEDPDNLHHYVATYTDSGTAGEWMRPETKLTPRGWAYNVIRIENTQAATYTFTLEGDESGSEGAASHFEARIVVMRQDGPAYSDLPMTDALDGSGSVTVTADDTDVYLVVASVPEHFTGNQIYGYSVRIDRQQ